MLVDAWPYLPSFAGLAGAVALLGISAAFIGLGSTVGSYRMPVEVSFISGWSISVLAATHLGAASAAPLTWALFPLVALGICFLVVSWPSRLAEPLADWGRLVLVSAPLLLIVSGASASQWDEFAHWLVNQRYLVDFGTFPRRGLSESPTIFAAYPYGLPLVGFLVSKLVGNFVENSGALLNTLLIPVLGATAVRAYRAGAGWAEGPLSWTAAAAALLVATLFNPTFVSKLTFTTYADWTTAVVLGVAVWVAWQTIDALAAGETKKARGGALHFGLALALLLALKQPNIILGGLLLLAVIILLLIGPPLPLRTWCSAGARVVLPPIAGYLAWRYHVSHHMPGREFSFLPLADWLWDDLGHVLARMLLIASKKGGYFATMLLATGVAMYVCVRRFAGTPVSSLGHLAVLVGTLFFGYNAFLYVAYVGAFGAGEGRSAASYWRYNTQLGGAALVFGAIAAGKLWRRLASRIPRWRGIAPLAVVVALTAPLLFAPKLRFDLNPVTRYVRGVGTEIASLAAPGARLTVIDPADNGKRALLLRYEMAGRVQVERLAPVDTSDPMAVRRVLANTPPTYVWIHIPTAPLAAAFGLDLIPLSSYLISPLNGAWQIVRSWPYPGYTDPVEEDD